MNRDRKVLLIGWDAADWKVIHKLMDEGRMPTLQKLIGEGVMGNMATLFPSLSPMLWTTIATGKRPYKHGIHGFTEPTRDALGIQPMTNVSRRCKAIWNILNQQELKSIVVGWWPSNPSEPINGVMVSDFFHRVPRRPGDPWRLFPESVHPPELLQELAKLRVHPSQIQPKHILPFVPFASEIDQDSDSRLASVIRILAECVTTHRVSEYLLTSQEWNFAAVYYDAIDHFCHGFMRYHPPQQRQVSDEEFRIYQRVVTQAYIYHDTILAKLLAAVDDDTTVILMSDHGFHPDHLRPKSIPNEPAGPAIEHRDFGIFVARGPGIKQDVMVYGASLPDITPTILHLYGLPVGEDMDGRALTEIMQEDAEVEFIPTWEEVDGDDGQHSKDKLIGASESKEALEQLIALGYVERPDVDASVAVDKCVCELNYNLARAYMDGGLHGEAIPLIIDLYNRFPLEFRFGLQLANCLKAMNRLDELELLIEDLNSRWRVASEMARNRLREVAQEARERRKQWKKLKELEEENEKTGQDAVKLARRDPRGRPVLFSDSEKSKIRKIRSVARGNPHVLDFLSATVAAIRSDFEKALDLLESAEQSKTRNPGFQFQLGNVYLGLNRIDDAKRAYSAALDIDEFYSGALMGLCQTSIKQGDGESAIKFGKQAVALKYFYPLAHYHLGNAKLMMDDIEGARESLNLALEQNPNFVEAHQKLAGIYAKKMGDDVLANRHRKTAKELVQANKEYTDSTERIEIKPSEDLDFNEHIPQLDEPVTNDFVRCLGQPKKIVSGDELSSQTENEIIVVTGLPRSGTSMMMQMLVAGGIEPYTDGAREPDANNPKGYFETDRAKQLSNCNTWVKECKGMAVKVIAPLIQFLPQNLNYRVIVMIRDIEEILRSQTHMLERLNRSGGVIDNERLGEILETQLVNTKTVLKIHEIPYLEIEYAKGIGSPEEITDQLLTFLPNKLNKDKMMGVIDPELYREQRIS